MGLFGNHDDEKLAEASVMQQVPAAGPSGQRIRVSVVERDNGLTTATNSSISNALYDLGDQNSLTHTVVLPHGTTVKLAATSSPKQLGSWRSKFLINNPLVDKTVQAVGTSQAADLANQIDVLAMGKADKEALTKVTEAFALGPDEVLIALGLREAPLEESSIKVSGYVTKDGRHVGAYSQIRKTIGSLKHGDTAHFPDGFKVKRTESHYELHGPHSPKAGAITASADEAAREVATRSARHDHPKSIGGPSLFKSHKEAEGADLGDSKMGKARQLTSGTNHPEPKDWKEQHDLLTQGRSLKVDQLKAAKAHAISKGDDRMAGKIDLTMQAAERRSSKSSRLVDDNPKLPGAPHPDDVAKRAAAARKSAKLPSRKERARNEGVATTTKKVRGLDNGESIQVGTSRVRRVDVQPPLNAQGKPGKGKGGTTFEVTGPGGRRGTGIWTDPAKAAGEAHSRHEGNSGSRRPGVTDARGASEDTLVANFKEMHGRAPSDKELATLRKTPRRREPNTDGLASYKVGNGTPGSGSLISQPKNSGRRGGAGAVDDPNGSKVRGASTDPDTFATEIKGWDADELRREAKIVPNSSPLYKLLVAELRRKSSGGHPAAKARNRSQGLAESAAPGFFGR